MRAAVVDGVDVEALFQQAVLRGDDVVSLSARMAGLGGVVQRCWATSTRGKLLLKLRKITDEIRVILGFQCCDGRGRAFWEVVV